MLPKQHRLSRKDFSVVFPQTKRFHSDIITLHYLPSLLPYRMSVVVGKKVSASAVVRNRIRRQLYALLRQNMQNTPVTGDYIWIVKPSIKSEKREHLEGVICQLLAQTKEKR